MANSLQKRGQKLAKKLSRFSLKASRESKEHLKENLVDRLPHVRSVRLLVLEWLLLTTAIIMLAITQALWYAESFSTSAFVEGGTYTEATLGKVSSLNPIFATTNSEKTLSKLLFATLVTVDYSGHTGPGLAASTTSDPTGKIWTVKLRPDLKWSDGEPLTNADVLFTINLIKDPTLKSAYASSFSKVKVAEKDNAIVFTLPAPYINFPSVLNLPILPQHVLQDVDPEILLEHNFSSSPVSSGAFTHNATQAIGSDGEAVVYLYANPNYYRGRPLLDSFAIHAFMDTNDIISALKNGSVTATAELSHLDAPKVTSSTVYEKQTTINNGVFLFFNTTRPALNQVVLRQAIRNGIDSSDLRALAGGPPPLDYPILPYQANFNPPKLSELDPDNARTVIAEHRPEQALRLATISTSPFPAIAERLADRLRNLGLDIAVEIYEPNRDFLINVISYRNYDMLLYEIELGADPDILTYYHSSQANQAGLNLSNYHNPLADDAILAARSTMDPRLRAAKYEAFVKHWLRDVPSLSIYQVNLAYFFNKNVRSFSEDNRLVYATDRFADVEHWAVYKSRLNRTP